MKGLVLAAGRGSRLGGLTERLPKTLLTVAPGVTLLDLALRNLRSVGITEVTVVVGFAAQAVSELLPTLERTHGVIITLIHNDRAETWNNAYSAWLATEWLEEDTIMVNGDTLHPAVVEELLLAAAAGDDRDLLVAIDDEKRLGAEEMKVVLSTDGSILRINKAIPVSEAAGEYIGVTLIRSAGVPALRSALEATWRLDPGLYYEDGFQVMADLGHRIGTVAIGKAEWVEVDVPDDLERAREIACRY